MIVLRSKRLSSLVVLAVMACVLAGPAFPQASIGRVSGTVTDQSGAAVPAARLTLTNTATNVTSSSVTNGVGFYLFPGLIPGLYRLSVEAPGMETYTVTFTAQVEQSVVIDPVLKPGQTTTSIDVIDVTPMVTVDTPMLRSALERARIEQLPMNGRKIATLLNTLPGIEGRRAFGSPSAAQEWIIDGSVNTDRRWDMNPIPLIPPVDSVQEFSVDASAVSAKHSRPVNVIVSTKSGTNEVHGSAFETHRNNSFGLARSRTDTYAQAPKLIRNEYGVSAGGPLVIPKVYKGKDRTFWFVTYERYRQIRSETRGYRVPTEAMRSGDFSGLKDSQERLLTLYDPLTTDGKTWARQPFSYGGKLNAIDPKRMSPLAKYIFSITPQPTNNVNPLVDNNWWGPVRWNHDDYAVTGRLDHRFSDRDQFFVRLSYEDSNHLDASGMQFLDGVSGYSQIIDGEKSGTVSWIHSFSPSFFNEFLGGVRRRTGGGYTRTMGVNWPDTFGLPNPFRSGAYQINNTGLDNYTPKANGASFANETYYTVDDNLTYIHGKHELQFGARHRFDQIYILPDQNNGPILDYGTVATALYDAKSSTPQNPMATPFTGHNLANLYLGHSTYANTMIRNWYYMLGGETALYFQDNFKPTSRLTLNLGLRWEHWRAYKEKNNLLIGFEPASHSMVMGTGLDTMYNLGATVPAVVDQYKRLGLRFTNWNDAGLPQNLVHSRNRNFAPRIGFAYKALDGKKAFVVRGGYSLAYFSITADTWLSGFNNATPLRANFNYDPNDSAQSPDLLPRYMMRSVPAYVNGVNDRNAIDLSQPRGITRGTAQASYFAPTLPDARTHSWNLTLEKEVAASAVARLRYVGNSGRNLNQWFNYNDSTPDYIWYATTGQPLPTGEYNNVARRPYDQQVLGTVQEYRSTAWSNYNGFEAELERRFSKGYGFQVSYVVGNAFTATTPTSTPMLDVNQFMPGIVPADYDERNAFLNYRRDTGIPKHRVRWNWLMDLPFGKGKWIGGNASGFVDKLIGGWQVAGLGSLGTTYFSLPTGNWNLTGAPVEIYGYKYPIENCTSGACVPGYLWWNGYIPANRINSKDANGKPNGYMGVPADYKPAVTPLIPWGSTALPANAPANTTMSQYWDTNNVWVPLKNGNTQRVGYNNGLHPWRNQFFPSVRQWGLDASLFKSIPITERFVMRLNADFFNVLNMPGNPNSVGGDGMLSTRSSGQTPRVLQLTLRLTW